MSLPEIPRTWIIFFLLVALVVLRAFGIDTWTTAALSLIIGYVTGQHIEAHTETKYLEEPK